LCDVAVFSQYSRIVALNRFVDYVPLVIDTELVRGFCKDLSQILRRSFKFSEPGAAERCGNLLQEPLDVKRERDRLKRRYDRLTRASEELRDFWAL
jgi:Dynamin GTPase effector domain